MGNVSPTMDAAPLPDRVDVVVIGSGYTGLTAARETAQLLESLGHSVEEAFPPGVVRPELVGSVGADDQERPVAGRARQFREDLQA